MSQEPIIEKKRREMTRKSLILLNIFEGKRVTRVEEEKKKEK
jgi:hypothetical protein